MWRLWYLDKDNTDCGIQKVQTSGCESEQNFVPPEFDLGGGQGIVLVKFNIGNGWGFFPQEFVAHNNYGKFGYERGIPNKYYGYGYYDGYNNIGSFKSGGRGQNSSLHVSVQKLDGLNYID